IVLGLPHDLLNRWLARGSDRKPIVEVLGTSPLLREERPSQEPAGCGNHFHHAHDQFPPPADPASGRIMAETAVRTIGCGFLCRDALPSGRASSQSRAYAAFVPLLPEMNAGEEL